MTIKDFEVGQTAYMYGGDRRREDRDTLTEVKVVKVGRKYVTTTSGRMQETRFSEGWTYGRELYLVEETEYGTKRILFREKKHADEWIEERNLRDELGKVFRWDNIGKLTLNQLREVKKIIEEGSTQ